MAQDRKITPEKRSLIHLSFYLIEVALMIVSLLP